MRSPSANGAARESQIIQTFLESSDTLVADFDIIDSLTTLAVRCVEILDAAASGILLADADGQLRAIAASSEQARLLELFQLQNEEGPWMEAFASGKSVIQTDLRAHIDMASAFDHIRARARNTNTKPTVVAPHLVAGQLDLATIAANPASTP